MFLAAFFTIQLVMKSAVDVDHCTFLLVDVYHPALFYLVDGRRVDVHFTTHHARFIDHYKFTKDPRLAC